MTAPAALGQATVRGVFWSGGGRAARQAIQIPTSIVLARLLVPEDFGLLGMAMVFVAVTQLVADFGIGAAIVQSKDVTRTTLASCFWANLAMALLLALLLVAGSRAIAAFYDEPRVASVLLGLAVSLVVSAMITVPRSILHKAMRFAADARAQVVGSLVGAAVAIAAAAAGLGVWSLVLLSLTANLVTLLLTIVGARWWPALAFSWRSIRELVAFSSGVLGSNFLSYVTRNADNLLIGRVLGSTALGHYALAYRLMLFPLTQVSSVIAKVLFPALATLQDDPARFCRAYLKSIAGIATVTFPMMLGLLAVADDFVRVVFGETWLPMVGVLRVFCVVGLLQSIGTTVGTIYLSTGRTRLMFLVSLAFTPLFVAAFVVGLRWGIEGVALAYGAVSVGLLYVSLRLAFGIVGLTLARFHRALAGPTAAALTMYVTVVLAGVWLRERVEAAELRLVVAVVLGIGVYGAASLGFNRRQVRELVGRVRGVVAG